MAESKKDIRAVQRRRRRALSRREQRIAAEHLAKQLSRRDFFLRARRAAFYLPNDGEIDPGLLRDIARAAGKTVYLPKLHPVGHNRLYFLPLVAGESLTLNGYGIPEPSLRHKRRPAPVWTLDIIFMPLVAFDRAGRRLGMGGGYYDRTLAPLARRPGNKPLLVGLAHHFQAVPELPAESWDIPLDLIATDRGIIPARRSLT